MIRKPSFLTTRMDAKLAVVFILIGLLPLLIAGALEIYQADQSLREQIMGKLQVVADSKAQKIEDYLFSREVDVSVHSQSSTVLSHLELLSAIFHQKGILSPEYAAAARNARRDLTPYTQPNDYDNVLLIDAGGDIVFSLFPTAEFGSNLRAAPYKDTPLARVFDNVSMLMAAGISDYEMDAASGEQKAFVTAPVFNQGVLIGALALRINNRELFEIGQDYTGLGETGETVIGRREGDAILLMGPTRADPDAAFHRRIAIGSRDGDPLQAATRGNSGIGQALDYRGQAVLAAWKYLPALRCGLVIKMDVAEAFAPIHAFGRLSVALGMAVVLLVALLAPLVAHYLAAPIRDLVQATRAFSAGDWTRRASIDSTDEIGNFADAFNKMAYTIQRQITDLSHARDDLELRVEERTADLAKTNLALNTEIAERKKAEEELRWKTAFLEAQLNPSNDGWLVVDNQGIKLMQNQRLIDLWKIPRHIAEDIDDSKQVAFVTSQVKNPRQFVEKITHLYAHPDETSHDEIQLIDGTILDRYSYPCIGKDGTRYGRIWTFRDITEQKRAEKMLRESEERFSGAFEHAPIGMALGSPDGAWLKVNRALCDLVGYSEAELLTRTFKDITHPEDLESSVENLRRLVAGEILRYQSEKRYIHARGHLVTVLLSVSLVRDDKGEPHYAIVHIQDITERKRLEAQLIQSQKMETVGKLAGGIAHEFNSILTAIIGQSELLLGDLPAGSPLAANALEINKAAARAATLTRQILAYGRKQFLQPEILDLNRLIGRMEGMLRHLMGVDVAMRIVPAPGLQTVKADAGQIEQVIINLAINAHDAMPNGGSLTLETANVSFEQESMGRYPELKPGDYVMLAITDTGAGMNAEAKAHLFEPFFSTKGVGQGTGLGLSTCYGIIKQSGGHIDVYSEPGRGTTFKIYLPQVEQKVKIPVQRVDSLILPPGTETILLVEDNPALREMAATLLRRLGYTVLVAANGIEALNLKQQRGVGHVDLLFTDVVMPHMSGRELADRVRALYPHTKILFTSAYTEDAVLQQGVLDKGVAMLQKPFTPSALAHKLREVLDRPNG